ncbi:hypothetical protein [Microbacterium sp. Kw_RZR3]|jgi:hypothetical protein|uniref:hypothetical protein n=1 Tax=unclassified Microbacterium TaxID=2609290 RepID=UPI0023D9B259|nr:hypothetical protein [Microbacterium sp. Kw_RZR3]MDF2048258.1 hypothetical protein [Microbacterium sp. Kw_RZR3]MDF2918373.1 transhydrogenase alpha subunit [Microbacterium sp.]
MNAGLVDSAVADVVTLAQALRTVDEDRYATFFDGVARDLLRAGSPDEVREAAARGLAVFGGMNSFTDLVLMDGIVPDVENNRRIDERREAVYDSLRRLV